MRGNVVRELGAALAVLLEGSIAGQNLCVRLDESQREVFRHRLGKRLAVPLFQSGFGVVKIEMARPAGHQQEDDIFCPRLEVRRFRSQRVDLRRLARRRSAFPREQVGNGDRLQPAGRVLEEVAAGLDAREIEWGHLIR